MSNQLASLLTSYPLTTAAAAVAAGPAIATGTDAADVLEGSDLADHLAGRGGDDVLRGHGGDDVLEDYEGNNQLYGGAGDDFLFGSLDAKGGSSGLLDGGDGNDSLSGHNGYTYAGGAGDDLISVSVSSLALADTSVDGGGGADRLVIDLAPQAQGRLTISGGAGVDTIVLRGSAPGGAQLRLTDFTAGSGGDQLDLSWYLPYNDPTNPFASGLLRLVSDGADTLLQLRSASGYSTALQLAGVHAAQLTSANFAGGIDPGGSTHGLTLSGTALDDILIGDLMDDVLSGGEGADLLNGMGGDDRLDGGAGNDTLEGGDGSDILLGGDGNDVLSDTGGAGDNLLDGGAGDDLLVVYGDSGDTLIGGAGTDTVRYAMASTDYIVTRTAAGFSVEHLVDPGRSPDLLSGIERLQFADTTIAYDTDDTAGQAFRIYRAAFNREPDAAGISFWLAQMDRGSSLVEIAAGFANSREFAELYGSAPTSAEIVTRMYTNILHRAPEPGGYAFWLDVLESGKADLPTVLAAISESQENRDAVAGLIAEGIPYIPYGG